MEWVVAPVVGFAGVIVGGMLTARATRRADEARAATEDRVRWKPDRRAAYLRYVALVDESFAVIAGLADTPRIGPFYSPFALRSINRRANRSEALLEEIRVARLDLRLIASASVADAGDALGEVVRAMSRELAAFGFRRAMLRRAGVLNILSVAKERKDAAVDAFVVAARDELGTDIR